MRPATPHGFRRYNTSKRKLSKADRDALLFYFWRNNGRRGAWRGPLRFPLGLKALPGGKPGISKRLQKIEKRGEALWKTFKY